MVIFGSSVIAPAIEMAQDFGDAVVADLREHNMAAMAYFMDEEKTRKRRKTKTEEDLLLRQEVSLKTDSY